MFRSAIGFLAIFFLFLLAANQQILADSASYPEVMIILDASGSMWEQVNGEAKIVIAKRVLDEIIPSMAPEIRLGLTVYGHRHKGQCSDIETVIPAGSDDRALLLSKINAINPKGRTPIADSVSMVVDSLESKENETTIILVSDGQETCNPDPCGVIRKLKATGIKFILHVIGFDVNDAQKKQLACLAHAGGGQYFTAGSASELLAALQTVQQEVVKKVEYEKARAIRKRTVSRIGKLKVSFPPGGEKSLAFLKIINAGSGKIIKTAENPAPVSIHPLLAGDYNLILGYANANYKPPSVIAPIPVTVCGGETASVSLGLLIFNIAEVLKKSPAESVTLRSSDGRYVLCTPGESNNYYFFTPKPLPAGTYSFEYMAKKETMAEPVVLSEDIDIRPNEETVLTLDCGFQLKKNDQDMEAFDLTAEDTGKTVLKIHRRWDNSYHLWAVYPVPPGTYSLQVYLKGMEEPLPVGQGIVLGKGQVLEFDTGL